MSHSFISRSVRFFVLACSILFVSACGGSSSPEGRMTMKIEGLQRELIDSLMLQNRAILDSLGKIREEIRELKQLNR